MSLEARLLEGAKGTHGWVHRLKNGHFHVKRIPEDAKSIICIVNS
jgi:hypothetical protein